MAKSGRRVLLFDPTTKKAWLYAFNLPALPSGKVYQLWAIDDKPVSAGVFGLDAGQKARMFIKNMGEFPRMKKFAVTVEPDGGRPEPTGAIYLIGQNPAVSPSFPTNVPLRFPAPNMLACVLAPDDGVLHRRPTRTTTPCPCPRISIASLCSRPLALARKAPLIGEVPIAALLVRDGIVIAGGPQSP